jgi:superfamily II DNA or RNA helicase
MQDVPYLKIVITTPRVSVIQTIYADLMKAGLDVGQAGGGINNVDHRIVVSTTKSLKKTGMQDCDLFLFDEVHNIGYNEVADTVAYVQKARKFGFTATATGRSHGAEMVMEALFGPVLAEIPYYDAVSMGLVVNIDVHMYRVPAGYMPDTKSEIVRKRWGYWRNKERNKAIAAVVRSMPADEQVLVMVETLEHAIYLHALLPDFTVVHYGNVSKERNIAGVKATDYKLKSSETKILRERFESGELKRVISTFVWREGVNFINLSALVRCDGSPSPISSAQIPGRLSRIAEGKDKAVLIDFLDEFDPWALRRSKQRVAQYRKHKWNITQRTLPA